jgi:hypothetical protein
MDARLLGFKFRHFRRRTFAGQRYLDSATGGKHAKRWRVYRHERTTEATDTPNTPSAGDSEMGHQRHTGYDSTPTDRRERPSARLFATSADRLLRRNSLVCNRPLKRMGTIAASLVLIVRCFTLLRPTLACVRANWPVCRPAHLT